MLDRCFIHQINAPSSCCCLSKVLLQKRSKSYAKTIHKKRKEKLRKMDRCLRYLKQWVLRCSPEKEEKIAHILLQKYFQVSKERYVFKEAY
jgi:hypothetical protein